MEKTLVCQISLEPGQPFSKQTATITVEEENLLWSKGGGGGGVKRTKKGFWGVFFFNSGKIVPLGGGGSQKIQTERQNLGVAPHRQI